MTALDALNRARRAWERSQPQYVIPGVLEEPQESGPDLPANAALRRTPPRLSDSASCGSSSPPHTPHTSPGGGLTESGTEPRRAPRTDGNQSVASEHPVLDSGVVVGAAHSTTTEAGANHFPVTRARLQEGL